MFKSNRFRSLLLAVCAPALVLLFVVPSAFALGGAPSWTVTAFSNPTNLAPSAGAQGIYFVRVENTGSAPSDGAAITIADVLPAGLKPGSEPASGVDYLEGGALDCSGLTCTYNGVVAIDDFIELKIPVEVEASGTRTVTNLVTVSGGGADEASRETPTEITSAPVKFGVAPGSAGFNLSTTQAGAHPDLTATQAFTTSATENDIVPGDPDEDGGLAPPGFAGDLADTPQCPLSTFSELEEGDSSDLTCPLSTVVGMIDLTFAYGSYHFTEIMPIFNLAPNPGEIARIGFSASGYGIMATVTLVPPEYRVRVDFQKIIDNLGQVTESSVTLWGVPSESIHNPMRDLVCINVGDCHYEPNPKEALIRAREKTPEGQAVTDVPIPYVTSPTVCTAAPSQGTTFATSWQEPDNIVTLPAALTPLTGCRLLEFAPAIKAAPDTTRADTPAGFTFDVKMGQEGLLKGSLNSEADIKDTTVTLPEGIAINPGQASGLGACQESQEELDNEAPPTCPSNSKVGTVEIETPILRDKLDGNVYVLQSNPPDVKLLVAPEDPQDGIYVKFVGDVHLNERTGQLVTTFEKTPELPFSDFKLSFSGGAQAALTTPAQCGVYTANSDFTPWSTPFGSDAAPSTSFAIEAGTDGALCPPSPLPFTPQMDAGATTDQAGGFTDFSLLLTRADDQQRISTLQFKTPEGLLGMIAKVPLCGEPQAAQGTCSAASQIGHTVVEAGPGPYPLVVPEPGRPPAPIYLTGGYKGAPYGLSIVVPLTVGPFNLGTIVVRSKIEVDPLTSQLTVTTDPLPSIIAGVPSDLRTINAVIDRPEFMFNPTSCAPMSFSGTATSTQGTSVPIATHYQVGSCRSLTFKPNFKVSTSGKTSRADGASLDAKIVYPTGNLGDNQASSQSNIKSVKVDLPKQLPSRLTTLQKACVAATFEANPASCPADSVVGYAKAVTPVLPVPLVGPAYFVSYGGAKFPELVIVLQGYGVTIKLHGETFISKAGITSSTFHQVPDVPIASFEIRLPQGPDSALAANGNLCASTLKMPTLFVAQNGAEIHQSTPIAVTGCARKAKAARHAKRGRTARHDGTASGRDQERSRRTG
jgi:hypothetical protein